MPTVLLVSNVRPDDSGGRASDFATRARLLGEHGWDVVVGHVPEPYVRSFLPSIWRCYRLARRVDADAINSVSNPLQLQLIGYAVSRLAGLPWLAEFRDPMVENPDREPGAPLTKVAKVVERLTVTRADEVVWGDGIQLPDDYYERTYGEAGARATKLPFKGFDPAMFEDVTPVEYDEFTITYAGSFYDGWIEPHSFVDGVARHVEEHGDDLGVQFFGDWAPEYDRAVEESGIADLVRVHDFVPFEELVPALKGSDLALYLGGDDPANRRNVSSKLWDYVGARTPVLAVVDPSFRVAHLVREHALGVVAPPSDPAGIADAVTAVRSGTFEYDPDEATVERFDRRRKMRRLSEILDEMVA